MTFSYVVVQWLIVYSFFILIVILILLDETIIIECILERTSMKINEINENENQLKSNRLVVNSKGKKRKERGNSMRK